jgi:hypothetical protein
LSVSSVAGLVGYKVGWLQFGLTVNGYKVNISSLILTRASITNTSSSSSTTRFSHNPLCALINFHVRYFGSWTPSHLLLSRACLHLCLWHTLDLIRPRRVISLFTGVSRDLSSLKSCAVPRIQLRHYIRHTAPIFILLDSFQQFIHSVLTQNRTEFVWPEHRLPYSTTTLILLLQ